MRYLLLGIGMLVIGIGMMVGGPLYTLFTSIGNVQRHAYPGEMIFSLEAATYTISHEYRSVIDGRSFSTTRQLPPIDYRLYRESDQSEVQLQPTTMSSSYQMGAYEGVNLFTTTIHTPGEYRLVANYIDDDGPEFVLAVQQGTFLSMFSTIMVISCGGGLLFIGGIVLSIVGLVLLLTSK
jgi:hypothetical protein